MLAEGFHAVAPVLGAAGMVYLVRTDSKRRGRSWGAFALYALVGIMYLVGMTWAASTVWSRVGSGCGFLIVAAAGLVEVKIKRRAVADGSKTEAREPR